mmetsp:Transcript_14405/g.43640  ORF Transcript_14405/g.43640 Transcript_14405/m.43640 type:complete len:446 (-) Transcript_14405:207-1544(-)
MRVRRRRDSDVAQLPGNGAPRRVPRVRLRRALLVARRQQGAEVRRVQRGENARPRPPTESVPATTQGRRVRLAGRGSAVRRLRRSRRPRRPPLPRLHGPPTPLRRHVVEDVVVEARRVRREGRRRQVDDGRDDRRRGGGRRVEDVRRLDGSRALPGRRPRPDGPTVGHADAGDGLAWTRRARDRRRRRRRGGQRDPEGRRAVQARHRRHDGGPRVLGGSTGDAAAGRGRTRCFAESPHVAARSGPGPRRARHRAHGPHAQDAGAAGAPGRVRRPRHPRPRQAETQSPRQDRSLGRRRHSPGTCRRRRHHQRPPQGPAGPGLRSRRRPPRPRPHGLRHRRSAHGPVRRRNAAPRPPAPRLANPPLQARRQRPRRRRRPRHLRRPPPKDPAGRPSQLGSPRPHAKPPPHTPPPVRHRRLRPLRPPRPRALPLHRRSCCCCFFFSMTR